LNGEILNIFARDSARCCNPRDCFSVTAIERERHPNTLAVIAWDLESIGTPASVPRIDSDSSIVLPGVLTRMPSKQQSVQLH